MIDNVITNYPVYSREIKQLTFERVFAINDGSEFARIVGFSPDIETWSDPAPSNHADYIEVPNESPHYTISLICKI